MTDRHATSRLHGHIAGSLVFLALAFAGWGAFLYTLRAATDREQALTGQVSRLEADLRQVAVEREQWRAAQDRQRDLERELTEARIQIQAARGEVATLTRTLDQTRTELEEVKGESASLTEQLNQANERVTRTGAVPKPTRRSIRRRGSR